MSGTSSPPSCAKCSKLTDIFKCHKCDKDYCAEHVVEHQHQHVLRQQLDAIVSRHEKVQENIVEFKKESPAHPLMQEIEQWEQGSTTKIQQVANSARNQLATVLNTVASNVTPISELLAEELAKAGDTDTISEAQLETWSTKLSKLEKDLDSSKAVLRKDTYNSIICIDPISTITLRNTCFGDLAGKINIQDEGQVIRQGLSLSTGSARLLCEYSSGSHLFNFRIEKMETSWDKRWIFFGIVSKKTPVKTQSYDSPTVYGWAGRNEVYCNGLKSVGLNGYITHMDTGSKLKLFIDCELNLIRLINEHDHTQHELKVEVDKCPFPWQVFVCLYYTNDEVRVLRLV